MVRSTLDQVPRGSRVFLDAPIFIYHFAMVSMECRRLLQRCESGEVAGVTSVVVLNEVTHRLMMMEALHQGLVTPGGVARKLRDRPAIVRQLSEYRVQVASIPGWGIEVLPLDLAVCLRSVDVRSSSGLLTGDSLIVTTMRDQRMDAIATSDADFERVDGLQVFGPTDLGPAAPALA
jgi:predicted nucleic acid-binding protein